MSRRGETLELAVLGLLHEHALHGYELRERLDVVLGPDRRGRALTGILRDLRAPAA